MKKRVQVKVNSLIAKILNFFKKISFPKKDLEGVEKLLDSWKRKHFSIAIYESELQAIGFESSSWDTETGGDLFGIWGDIPVVYLATRVGPDAIRDKAHFRLDINYLIKLSGELQHDWGLRYFGDWHSHHRLGIEVPSNGDQVRIKSIALKNNFHDMAEFIVTFAASFINKNIYIHSYTYLDFPSYNLVPTKLVILKGLSPVREALLAASLLPEQQLNLFSSFSIDRIITKKLFSKAYTKEVLPTKQIGEKVFAKALAELAKISSEAIESHKTSFGYIIVISINGYENVAIAIDQEWPYKILQVNWMNRLNGKTEEIPLKIESASLVNITEVKNIFLEVKKLKKGTL